MSVGLAAGAGAGAGAGASGVQQTAFSEHQFHPELLLASRVGSSRSNKRNIQQEHQLHSKRRASLEFEEDGAVQGCHSGARFVYDLPGGEFVRGGQSKAEEATMSMMAAYERSRVLLKEAAQQEEHQEAGGCSRLGKMDD
jgi:hypothetical protein